MNSLYILIILLLIPFLCFIIEKIFSDKYKNIEANSKLTGFEVSRKLLDSYDRKDIYIVEIKTGDLTDHFDSKQEVVRLSSSVYYGTSIYSTAVALYFTIQAIMNKNDKSVIQTKGMLDNFVEFGYIIIGIILLMWVFMLDEGILMVALVLFSLVLIYEIVMVPVGFKIAKQAISNGEKYKIVDEKELEYLQKICNMMAFSEISRVILLINKGVKNLLDSIRRV